MIRECFNCNSGIVFNARMLQKIGLPVYEDLLTHEPMLAPLYTWHPNEPRTFTAPPPPKGKSNGATRFSKRSYITLEDGENSLLEKVPNEYEEDLADIVMDEHDQLQRKLLWKVLEYIPMYYVKIGRAHV